MCKSAFVLELHSVGSTTDKVPVISKFVSSVPGRLLAGIGCADSGLCYLHKRQWLQGLYKFNFVKLLL